MKAQRAEQKRLAEEAKLLASKKGIKDPNSPLKSALARKQQPASQKGSVKEQWWNSDNQSTDEIKN